MANVNSPKTTTKNLDPILIVDDEKDNLEALRRLLRNQYEVTITESPFEALKLIRKNTYHVIVSDQRMPEMTGVELLEKAKALSPVSVRILLTGYTDIDSVIGAINRGNIYRYIAKPWDPEDLRLTLRQANEAFRLRRELDEKNQILSETNDELKRALESLQVLDRAKARFLSLISHELNTPLTVITAFVALLSDKKNAFPKEIEKAIASLSSASDRFSHIVEEVLTYVKLGSEEKLSLQNFDLKKETEALQATLLPLLKAKPLEMSLSAGEKTETRCDPEKMRVALRKLLEDTISRAPSGTQLKVEISSEGKKLRYAVWREGEPVSEAAFTAFETAGQELHHHRNLGLSLAICKMIVEGHGGEIGLSSKAKTGTTITLLLP